eukprot:scaffold4163_cov425-Prasinococcus_capsulatus_cf.AAC.6
MLVLDFVRSAWAPTGPSTRGTISWVGLDKWGVDSARLDTLQLGRRCVALFVAGGGARNPTIIRHLEDEMGYHVHQLDTLGVPADAREARPFLADHTVRTSS